MWRRKNGGHLQKTGEMVVITITISYQLKELYIPTYKRDIYVSIYVDK